MNLCHLQFLPAMPRLQKIISCLWLQSINRCPINASWGGKGNTCTQDGERWNVYTNCAGPANYYIPSARIWDINVNWNKPSYYIFSHFEEKEGFWKTNWETFTSPSFTICDWTYGNSQNTVASLISCPSVACCLIRTPTLEVAPSLTAKTFQQKL